MVHSGLRSPALKSNERTTFFISLFLYALLLLPILIADQYYLDDWGRTVLGYLNWGLDGRPLTDSLMNALDLGKPMVDFSPICQIASIFCLAWLSALIARKFEIRRPIIAAVSTFPLGANPFFLANLTFKFDSFPMTLSLSMALIPVILDDASIGNGSRSTAIGALFLFGSLCLYQPSLNAFIGIATLEYLLLEHQSYPSAVITSLIRRRILQLIIAACAYTVVAMFTIHEKISVERSQLVSGAGALATVLRNIETLWSIPIVMLTGMLRSTLVVPIVLALIASLAVGLRYSFRPGRTRRVLWTVSAFVTPILMLFGTFGFLIFLQFPTGGARTFVGFGVLLASSFIFMSTLLTEWKVAGRLQCCLLFIPAYTMIAFAAIYANATKVQKDYERHIAEKLSDDIMEVIAVQPVKNYVVVGSVGYAPLVKRMGMRRYRLLLQLIQIDLRGDAFAHAVLGYFGIYIPAEISEAQRASGLAKAGTAIPVRSNPYYQIFVVDQELIVHLIGSS